MPTTKTVVLYTFDELSDDAKERARDWYRRACADDNDYAKSVYEDAADVAELMGLDIRQRRGTNGRGETTWRPSIHYSGFWSQGSGACFDGSWRADLCLAQKGAVAANCPRDIELQRIAGEFERIAAAYPSACFSVKHRGHYYHSGCTEFDVDLVTDDELDAEPDALRAAAQSTAVNELKRAARDFMDWIYKQLESGHEYQNAAEQVDESILCNGYTFLENGERED
jgi:hypothetical protein